MKIELTLDANTIYNKEFSGTNPGYDALQVDAFLDTIIEDYEKMKNYIIENEKTIDELTKKNTYLSQELDEVQTENATLKQKLSGIEANSDTSLNNLELLKRISSLEKALKKVGINPNNI